ncbi:uncharacterized protein LOC128039243 [Gossypium raimondii]|uniref:uncharacterized protein LOC128039243 n=1 Tax=Gossypium raimondii TaxID=29730 RepID=UPI00227A19ED|nr:uncharacterized protein LOC128039243 [Gossypium raimondii]
MPFGFKNACATYQRLIKKMFNEHIGRSVEAYVDDMLVKSSTLKVHIKDLSEAFVVLQTYNMKLNPGKCSFGVRARKFLGSIVSNKGTKANPEKIWDFLDMPPPKTIKDIQRLTWRVVALNSKVLQNGEKRYSKIEKLIFALIVAVRKLQPYFQAHLMTVITKQPIKDIFSRVDTSAKTELGAGIFLIDPDENEWQYKLFFNFQASNSTAEYKALVSGLQLALQLGVKELVIQTDSQLVEK